MKVNNILIVGLFVTTILAIFLINNIRNEKDDLQKRLNNICSVSKAGLEGTIRAIRTNASNKDAAINRIFGEGDVTGTVVLGGCTPAFDSDKWNECVFNNDEPCMLRMLNEAAKSIKSD